MRVWTTAGLVLLAAAVLLCVYNVVTDQRGGSSAETVLTEMQSQLEERQAEAAETPEDTTEPEGILSEYQTETSTEETLLEIDGQYYLGYISIPAIGIELPVLSEWSYANLKIAPCRYEGTIISGDLILAAHNYTTHFGKIKNLNVGDLIYFTDGDGDVHTYEVTQTDLIYGYDISGMEDGADDWDLTLFTCTWSGTNRVTVRAVEQK